MTADEWLTEEIRLVGLLAEKEGLVMGPIEWVKLAPLIQESVERNIQRERRFAELMEMCSKATTDLDRAGSS